MADPLRTKVAELKSKTHAELALLGEYQDEKITDGDGTIVVAVWKDVLASGELRLVVQAYRHVLVGVGTMSAEGFRVDRNNTISDLTEEEIREFT
jgi:hypothetical protein